MKYLIRVAGCLLVIVSLSKCVDADIIGDEIEASFTIDPDQNFFDENAISGPAIVVDPGREYQGQITSTPNGVDFDFFVDINESELTFGFERTDSSNGDFASGLGRTLTLLIWDIDWTANPIEVDYLSQFTFGNSSWEDGTPENYAVTTTSSSIRIDIPSGYRLGGDGGIITATYAISSVPEPGSVGVIALLMLGCTLRRSRKNQPAG